MFKSMSAGRQILKRSSTKPVEDTLALFIGDPFEPVFCPLNSVGTQHVGNIAGIGVNCWRCARVRALVNVHDARVTVFALPLEGNHICWPLVVWLVDGFIYHLYLGIAYGETTLPKSPKLTPCARRFTSSAPARFHLRFNMDPLIIVGWTINTAAACGFDAIAGLLRAHRNRMFLP